MTQSSAIGRTLRCAGAGAALFVLDWLAWTLLAPPARAAAASLTHWRGADAVTLVADAAVVLLAVAAVAVSISVTLTLADAVTAFRIRPLTVLARGSSPVPWRRAILAVCAAGLLAPLPATAADGDAQQQCSRCGSEVSRALDGLPLPQLPAIPAATTHPQPPASTGSTGSITVHDGESLWTIAERLLPSQANVAQIAALTNTLYTENRAVIGPDPHLIFPGTHLTVPEGRP